MMSGSSRGAARIGIGGPVGSGKTALIEALLPRLKSREWEVALITNDLLTKEDAERIQRGGLIEPKRVRGVETGACPHTAIREDPSSNLDAIDDLQSSYPDLDLIILESGGDNLASTFSLELVDYWMFVLDVSDGEDIPRKRGPGVVQSDLLVVNKIDLAPYVGVDLDRMREESLEVRGDRSVQFTNARTGEGVDAILDAWAAEVVFR